MSMTLSLSILVALSSLEMKLTTSAFSAWRMNSLLRKGNKFQSIRLLFFCSQRKRESTDYLSLKRSSQKLILRKIDSLMKTSLIVSMLLWKKQITVTSLWWIAGSILRFKKRRPQFFLIFLLMKDFYMNRQSAKTHSLLPFRKRKIILRIKFCLAQRFLANMFS